MYLLRLVLRLRLRLQLRRGREVGRGRDPPPVEAMGRLRWANPMSGDSGRGDPMTACIHNPVGVLVMLCLSCCACACLVVPVLLCASLVLCLSCCACLAVFVVYVCLRMSRLGVLSSRVLCLACRVTCMCMYVDFIHSCELRARLCGHCTLLAIFFTWAQAACTTHLPRTARACTPVQSTVDCAEHHFCY